MRAALGALAQLHAAGRDDGGTAAIARGKYWSGVSDLAARTDSLFEVYKIHQLASDWTRYATLLDDGWEGVVAGVGFSEPTRLSVRMAFDGTSAEIIRTDGPEPAVRARAMASDTLDLAVRSITQQVAGKTPAEADELVAHAYQAQSAPGVYRKRLRDRAD